MQLSVIIPTQGRADQLEACLQSLARQDFALQDLEICVIDNPGDLRTRVLCQIWQERLPLRYYQTGQKGVNRARNWGMHKARGSIFYFLDDDVQLKDAGHLRYLVQQHQSYPEVDAWGGPCSSPKGAAWPARIYNAVACLWLYSGQCSQKALFLLGGNMSLKRRFWDQGWSFDALKLYGGAETSLLLELAQNGYKLQVDPNLNVEHMATDSWWSLWRKAYVQGQAKAQMRWRRLWPAPELSVWTRLQHVRRTPTESYRVRAGAFLYIAAVQVSYLLTFLTMTSRVTALPAVTNVSKPRESVAQV